ncbi:hypothetical protein ACMAZH_08410 [Arenicellales bacterium nBUS_45]
MNNSRLYPSGAGRRPTEGGAFFAGTAAHVAVVPTQRWATRPVVSEAEHVNEVGRRLMRPIVEQHSPIPNKSNPRSHQFTLRHQLGVVASRDTQAL